eukprot:4573760-Pyramimonas_sp.AAC.1
MDNHNDLIGSHRSSILHTRPRVYCMSSGFTDPHGSGIRMRVPTVGHRVSIRPEICARANINK